MFLLTTGPGWSARTTALAVAGDAAGGAGRTVAITTGTIADAASARVVLFIANLPLRSGRADGRIMLRIPRGVHPFRSAIAVAFGGREVAPQLFGVAARSVARRVALVALRVVVVRVDHDLAHERLDRHLAIRLERDRDDQISVALPARRRFVEP